MAFPRLVSASRTGISVGKTLSETLGLVTAIGLAAFAVLALMPGVVVDVLFGPKYADAASIVGIIALTSVFLSIIGLLTYFHVARRSVAALYSWAGVALVCVLVAELHGGMETIAVCMLAGSVLVLVAVSLPALTAVLRPVSRTAVLSEGAVQLPSAEIDLSLVIPFYNPGLRLASHIQDVVGVLRAEHVTFEVIAVSDGSTDGSPSSIAGIDQVRIVELAKNQGKGAALRVGLAQGRGRYLGFIDADGDIPASARIRNYFLTGLVLVGPVFVTVYLTWSFITWVDGWVKPLVPPAWRPETYLPYNVPGTGLVIAFVTLTLLGFLTANLVGKTLVEFGEKFLDRMPVVRPIYRTMKQIFETVFSKDGSSFRTVGLVEFPAPGMWSLVFVSQPPSTGHCRSSSGRRTRLGVFAVYAQPDDGFFLLHPAQGHRRSRS